MPIEVQLATAGKSLPTAACIQGWAECALEGRVGEICIRIAGKEESKALNGRFRDVAAPTNVLSFPAGVPMPKVVNGQASEQASPLGDIMVCAPVVEAEAREQGKPLSDHFAHMVVHGVLHLRGYDHASKREAQEMEKLEAAILGRLGIADPYRL